MSPKSGAPAPAVLAASLLLVRDGAPGLEVFLVERHRRIEFAAGALVFPGGKADPGDGDPAAHARCAGTPELSGEAVTARVAGIREAFEECGLLLARPRGHAEILGAGRAAELVARYADDLRGGRLGIGEVAEREDLELAGDLLVPFAHWITPEFMPRRYDTHFFLAAAPADQRARHDGHESVDSRWTRPADALADAEAGRCSLMFPTRMNLARLGRSGSVEAALEAARVQAVVTVLPRLVEGPDGPRLRLPPDAGYESDEVPVADEH